MPSSWLYSGFYEDSIANNAQAQQQASMAARPDGLSSGAALQLNQAANSELLRIHQEQINLITRQIYEMTGIYDYASVIKNILPPYKFEIESVEMSLP